MSGDRQQAATRAAVDERLSVEQLAAELGVTPAAIRDWLEERQDVPHHQLASGAMRFRRSEIAPLLRAHQDGLDRQVPPG